MRKQNVIINNKICGPIYGDIISFQVDSEGMPVYLVKLTEDQTIFCAGFNKDLAYFKDEVVYIDIDNTTIECESNDNQR